MRPERGGRARRLACLIALGCLIGAATAAGTTFLSAAPAPAASCSSAKANVEGFRYSGHYGVRGFVYVNKNATVNAYYYLFVRSVLVKYDNSNWVEVGWLDHEYGVNGPTVFAFWENGTGNYPPGDTPVFHGGVNYDSSHTFRVDRPPSHSTNIFQFWFDHQSSYFAESPNMSFKTGSPIGNSERHNWCQSLWTRFKYLNNLTSSGWTNWDNWDGCVNTSVRKPYYMHRNSSTEFHVNGTSPNNLNC